MKTLTALDLRKRLGSILNEVHERKERFIVSRANKPLAVIISVDEYEERVLKKERGRKLQAICAGMEKWKKEHGNETGRIDVTDAIREMRDRR
jgi:prevent-host-death family protein